MAARPRPARDDGSEPHPVTGIEVAALETCPGRTVFIESGNTEGWIATDLAVDPLP